MTRARDLANVADDVSTGTVVTTASPSLGRRNLIINGGFDIWQRGTSFSAIGNNVFAPDRWYSTKVATGCTISRDTGTYSKYAMLITGDAANTAQSMTQRIEASTSFNMSLNDHTFSAKVYTSVDRTIAIQIRSATAEDDFSGNTLQQNTSVDLVTGWNTVNISVPSVSAYNLGVQLTLAFGTVGAGETVKVEQVQLEVGSVATPFEHRSYGEELDACMRYYQYYSNKDYTLTRTSKVEGSTNDANVPTVRTPLSKWMRANPTATFSNGSVTSSGTDFRFIGFYGNTSISAGQTDLRTTTVDLDAEL